MPRASRPIRWRWITGSSPSSPGRRSAIPAEHQALPRLLRKSDRKGQACRKARRIGHAKALRRYPLERTALEWIAPLEEQEEWRLHADFMNALHEAGFVL